MSTQVKSNEVVANVNTLLARIQFRGEQVATMGDMSTAEAIRVGVSLVNMGEESKARGIFVLAKRSQTLSGDDLTLFREALLSELVNEAKDKAINALAPDSSDTAKEKAKRAAADEAKKRFDNLGQTMRAARWMLDNPRKIADAISVFTVQQANAYLEAPKPNNDGVVDADKLALHKAVLPLLGKPGTSQGMIKSVVSAKKDALAKAKTPADNRSEEQKKQDSQLARMRSIVHNVNKVVSEWSALVDDGVKTEDIRNLLLEVGDASKGKLSDQIGILATLAGLPIAKK